MLALAAVTLLATATSILPAISWHGSYARGQGALTTLAYLVLALVVLACLRHPRQAERLATAIALAGLAPAAYGWVQHFGRDPLPWQQPDLTARVPGTMGNPIFLGALLVMTLPLALYRLVLTLQRRPVPTCAAVPTPRVATRPALAGTFPAMTLQRLVCVTAGSPPQPSGADLRTVDGRVRAMTVHGQVAAISHQAL